MSYLDPIIYGCALPDQYGFAPDDTHRVVPVAEGRARYRLVNPLAVPKLGIQYLWTDEVFGQFKTFWGETINHGADWFTVDLLFGGDVLTYSAHATGPYSARTIQAGRWGVSIPIEAKRVPV